MEFDQKTGAGTKMCTQNDGMEFKTEIKDESVDLDRLKSIRDDDTLGKDDGKLWFLQNDGMEFKTEIKDELVDLDLLKLIVDETTLEKGDLRLFHENNQMEFKSKFKDKSIET